MFKLKGMLKEAKSSLKNIDSDGGEIELNNPDVIDSNSKGNLLFDDLTEDEQGQYQQIFTSIMGKDYPGKELGDLSGVEKSTISSQVEDIWDNEEDREGAIAEIKRIFTLKAEVRGELEKKK